MLHYFPTPYPDELWYSVIARYHTHSGALSWQATMEALFGNACDADVGSFFPNNSIHKILEQLPPGFLLPVILQNCLQKSVRESTGTVFSCISADNGRESTGRHRVP